MTKHASLLAHSRVARYMIAALVAGSAVFGLVPKAFATPAAPGMSAAQMAVAFEWAIDVERGSQGLNSLTVDPAVSAQAQRWSGGMALFNTLAEDRFFSVELSATYPNWQWSGENVGVGSAAASIEAAFMASPGHRANVLGNYTHVGVGVVIDGAGRIWVTERFYR